MEVYAMKIRPKETFEQTHQKQAADSGGAFGSVDFLKFAKNTVYEFFIVPKVSSMDIAADECEIDYPFEEVNTHFGTYEFMQKYGGMRPVRINCTGCAIDNWMTENRVPKSVFRIAVPTKFFVTYVAHDKKIKIAWFQDYLYRILMERISKLMTDKNINLIDSFRHRIKLFTNPEGKFDIEVNPDVAIPSDSAGYKNLLMNVHEKPLNKFIEEQVVCDPETVGSVLSALKDYTNSIIKAEKDKERNEKMEARSEQFAAGLEGFKNTDYKPGGNAPFVESVGPAAETPDDDIPF
jgi:hypothetical protein